MLKTLFLCSFLAGLPLLESYEKTSLSSEQLRCLPSSMQLSSVADTLLLSVINQQVSGAGIDRLDRNYLSFHGSSWSETEHLLNGLDLTDPVLAGSPGIELPFLSLRRLEFLNQHQRYSGFNSVLHKESFFYIRGQIPAGGDTWLPQGLMDREPATDYGAQEKRRQVDNLYEIHFLKSFNAFSSKFSLTGDLLRQEQSYPFWEASDHLGRGSIFFSGETNIAKHRFSLLTGFQKHFRSFDGIQYRHPEQYTKKSLKSSFLQQFFYSYGDLDLKFSILSIKKKEDPNGTSSYTRELTEQWMWFEDTQKPKDQSSSKFHGVFSYPLVFSDLKLSIYADFYLSGIKGNSLSSEPEGLYFSDRESDKDKSISMKLFEKPFREDLKWFEFRPSLLMESIKDELWELDIALYYVKLLSHSKELLKLYSPSARGKYKIKYHNSEIYSLLSVKPVRMNYLFADFVDPYGLSGKIYDWDDINFDKIADENEKKSQLGVFGGAYRDIKPGLSLPVNEMLSFGYKYQQDESFYFTVNQHFKWLRDRYKPVYKNGPEFKAASLKDPIAGKLIEVYETSADLKDYRFEVVNAENRDFYFGTEFQFATKLSHNWYLSFAGAGWLSKGEAAFGVFPSRNDAFVLKEYSADPNSRIESRGRYDHDRAYTAHLTSINKWTDSFLSSLVIRYRDGQPITRIMVAELRQGPRPVMAYPRGDPLPRHTFHMTMDLRLNYFFKGDAFSGSLSADFLNLLGSGTEILEDFRSGENWRRSMEMTTGRYFGLSLELRPVM